MLKRIQLWDFAAYGRFSMSLSGDSFIVGPNSAGKSTLIAAVKLGSDLVNAARGRSPDPDRRWNGRSVPGYPFRPEQYGLPGNHVHHNMRDVEARIRLTFKPAGIVTIVFPRRGVDEDEDDTPFFFMESADGLYLRNRRNVRDVFPALGTVPVLTPCDADEALRDDKYIRANVAGRLASRHFRNHLRLLKQDEDSWADFLDYCDEWLPELAIVDLFQTPTERGYELDLIVREKDDAHEREISWVGDGVQIFLQVLYHTFRLRDVDSIILDEPDVYLHPDLQRRLALLLNSCAAQTITATHSVEMIAGVPAAQVALVDKTLSTPAKAPTGSVAVDLQAALGSAFNLRIAKALRAHAIMFVEGDDAGILRMFARALGIRSIERETSVTVIKLEGFDAWAHVGAFDWLIREVLGQGIPTWVVLDNDIRSPSEVEKVEAALTGIGLHAHIWSRHEIENYLVNTDVMSRAFQLSADVVDNIIGSASDELRDAAHDQGLMHALKRGRVERLQDLTVIRRYEKWFNELWAQDPLAPRNLVSGKDLLSRINSAATARGAKGASIGKLAKSFLPAEIPLELKELLESIDNVVPGSR